MRKRYWVHQQQSVNQTHETNLANCRCECLLTLSSSSYIKIISKKAKFVQGFGMFSLKGTNYVGSFLNREIDMLFTNNKTGAKFNGSRKYIYSLRNELESRMLLCTAWDFCHSISFLCSNSHIFDEFLFLCKVDMKIQLNLQLSLFPEVKT